MGLAVSGHTNSGDTREISRKDVRENNRREIELEPLSIAKVIYLYTGQLKVTLLHICHKKALNEGKINQENVET